MAVSRPDFGCPFPRHWDELLEGDFSRFRLLTPLLPVDAFDMMLTLLASLGEEDLPLDDRRFCSEGKGLLALSVLKRLYRAGPEEAVSWNPIRVLETLSTTDDFAASPCLFGYINYARPGFRPHRLTYRDLPTFAANNRRRAILGGAGIGVSAKSGRIELAMQLAHYLASEPVQSGVYLENEGQPAHLATWEKRRLDPRYIGFMDGAFETMNTAWTRPRAEWFLHFVDDVCEIFPDYFRKQREDAVFLAEIDGLYRHHCTSGNGA
jgi:multiple sugar transport system substrate-binding protein